MTSRYRLAILLLALGNVGIFSVVMWALTASRQDAEDRRMRPAEIPSSQGKSLYDWASVWHSARGSRDQKTEQLARTALDEMDALNVLVNILRDDRVLSEDRVRAAVALGRIGEPAATVPVLTDALRDKDSDVRGAAARALGSIGPNAAGAVPALTDALKDPDAGVRSSAALALGWIGPDAHEAVPALIGSLRNPEFEVRRSAIQSLRLIGRKAVPALIEALKDPDDSVSGNAYDALSEIGPEAVPALIGTLDDPDAKVRKLAAFALRNIGRGAESAVAALIDTLDDPDAEVRYAAAAALVMIETRVEEAIRVLIEEFKHGDSRYAALYLGYAGPKAAAAVPALTEALKAGNYARDDIEEALKRIDFEAAKRAGVKIP